jgi:hypothetical protein
MSVSIPVGRPLARQVGQEVDALAAWRLVSGLPRQLLVA